MLYRSYLWMPAYALLLGFLLMGGDGWLARAENGGDGLLLHAAIFGMHQVAAGLQQLLRFPAQDVPRRR